MTFDKNLRRAAQDLRRNSDHLAVPPALRSRVLVSLPSLTTDGVPGASGTAARLVGVALTVSLVAAGFGARFLFDRAASGRMASHVRMPLGTAANPAAASHVQTPAGLETARVRAAVDQQNTWHLSGTWRFVNAKTGVRSISTWEEWSRRSPYFFHLDCMGETIIDDGQTIVHIIPPRQTGPSPKGLGYAISLPGRIVIRRSEGPTFRSMDNSRLLATNPQKLKPPFTTAGNTGGAASGIGNGSSERLIDSSGTNPSSPDTLTLEMVQHYKGLGKYPDTQNVWRLVENRQSHLPLRYTSVWNNTNSVRAADNDKPTQTEEIRAEYGRALPPTITKLGAKPGYTVIDLAAIDPSLNVGQLRNPHPVRIALRPEPVNEDSGGIYTCRLKVDFGLESNLSNVIGVMLENMRARDDSGNVEVCASAQTTDPRVSTAWIAPADPENVHQSHPGHIAIDCDAVISGQDASSTLDGGPTTTVHLVGSFTIGSDLKRAATGMAAPGATGPPGAASTPLEAIAVARAEYFGFGRRHSAPPSVRGSVTASPAIENWIASSTAAEQISPSDAALAIHWWKVAADEAERAGKKGAARTYRSWEQHLLAR